MGNQPTAEAAAKSEVNKGAVRAQSSGLGGASFPAEQRALREYARCAGRIAPRDILGSILAPTIRNAEQTLKRISQQAREVISGLMNGRKGNP